MRFIPALAFVAALAASAVAQEGDCPAKPDHAFGTALNWEPDNAKAASQAKQAGKLLLMLHLSGHFEDPGRT